MYFEVFFLQIEILKFFLLFITIPNFSKHMFQCFSNSCVRLLKKKLLKTLHSRLQLIHHLIKIASETNRRGLVGSVLAY